MLGNLYKDLYRHRWVLLSILGITLFYSIMLFAQDPIKTNTNTVMSYLIIALPIFLASGFSLSSITKDEKSNWLKYALSLPGGNNTYIFSKYIFYLVCEMLSILVSLILAILINAIKSYVNFTPCIVVICTAFLITLFCSSLELPLALRFGAKTGNNIKAISLLLIFCGLLYYVCMCDISYWIRKDYMKLLRRLQDIHFIKLYINLGCLAIGGIVFYVSYIISKRFIKIKEH